MTGRPAYHPATLLKIYVYGYLNRVQSSRRLERECQRNTGAAPTFPNGRVDQNSLLAVALAQQVLGEIAERGSWQCRERQRAGDVDRSEPEPRGQ